MLRGRCGCRAVSYEVADEFVVAYNCHCSNCRAMTGSAFLAWGEIEPEKLRVTQGEDALIRTGDPQGHHAARCGQCFAAVLDGLRRQDPRALWVTCRRAGSQADRPICSLAPKHRGTRFLTTFPARRIPVASRLSRRCRRDLPAVGRRRVVATGAHLPGTPLLRSPRQAGPSPRREGGSSANESGALGGKAGSGGMLASDLGLL